MGTKRLIKRFATLLVIVIAAYVIFLGTQITKDPLASKRKFLSLVQADHGDSIKLSEDFRAPQGSPRHLHGNNNQREENNPLLLQSSHASPLSEDQVKQRFEHRLSILHNACALYYNSSLFRPKKAGFHTVPLYPPIMNVNIKYCPIAKTAATSWTHYIYGINNYMKKIGIEGTEDRSKATGDVYFTFVREPYARMLSGYVDKLLTPNSLFWRATGKVSIKLFRQNATEKSLKCGHDLTFPEFVRYVIYSQNFGKHQNGHFIPTHDQCDMCTLPYRYIGHLETIKEDMPFIIKAIQSPVNSTASYDEDTIRQNSKMILWDARIKDVLKCMDLDEASRRLWKKFQIRGLISKREKFPYRKGRATNIKLQEFVRVALEAHERSQKDPNLKQQRVEALREAWAQVPLPDKVLAQQTLFLDFQMFGFDPMLEDVFPKTPYIRDKSFSYFRIFD